MTLAELAVRWREDAALLDAYGDVAGMRACLRHADQLEAAIREAADAALTLAQAAAESGYSERRLREMIAAGAIGNAGRRGAPRIRRGDLPRRAKREAAYDPAADARAVMRGAT